MCDFEATLGQVGGFGSALHQEVHDIYSAALGPFKNRPTAADEETTKVCSVSVAISLVGRISGKSLKLLPPDVIF